MRGNVPFQCIHNSLSLKASSPQLHTLCSTACDRGLFSLLRFSRINEVCLPAWKLLQEVSPLDKQLYLYQTQSATSSKSHQLGTGARSTARTGCSAPGSNAVLSLSVHKHMSCSSPLPQAEISRLGCCRNKELVGSPQPQTSPGLAYTIRTISQCSYMEMMGLQLQEKGESGQNTAWSFTVRKLYSVRNSCSQRVPLSLQGIYKVLQVEENKNPTPECLCN